MATIFSHEWSTNTALPVTQVDHGFAVGDQVYSDGAAWFLALATDPSTLRQGTVAQVVSNNQFLLAFEGVMDWPAHGLRVGAIQYLSDTVPGGLSETPPPSVLFNLRQMIAVAISPDRVRLLPEVVQQDPAWSSQTGQSLRQVNHGFARGDQIYFDGNVWRKAQANSPATLRMATVAYRLSADTFILGFEGVMEWPAHGLTSGVRYYLSDTVAGGVITTPPTAPSTFQQPVLVPLGPNHVRLLEYLVPDSSGASTPTGTILASAGNGVPSGFLPCEGGAVSRSTYSALFSVIGTNWGAGDGTNTFNLPDLRDWYLRGCGTANTPGTVFQQATARPTTAFTGVSNTTGNHNHTINSAGQHTHTYTTFGQNNWASGGGNPSWPLILQTSGQETDTLTTNAGGAHTHTITENGNHSHTTSITGGGDAETRPRSKHVLYLIKF